MEVFNLPAVKEKIVRGVELGVKSKFRFEGVLFKMLNRNFGICVWSSVESSRLDIYIWIAKVQMTFKTVNLTKIP